MFSWLSWFFQPEIVRQFRQQLDFYSHDMPSSKAGKVTLSLWFVFAFVVFKPKISGVESWKLLYFWFPQVNFSRPSLLDPLRVMIQGLWVTIVPQNQPT